MPTSYDKLLLRKPAHFHRNDTSRRKVDSVSVLKKASDDDVNKLTKVRNSTYLIIKAVPPCLVVAIVIAVIFVTVVVIAFIVVSTVFWFVVLKCSHLVTALLLYL